MGERNLAPFANLMLKTHGGDAPPAYRDDPRYQPWPTEGWHDNWWSEGRPQQADPQVKLLQQQLPERGEGDLSALDNLNLDFNKYSDLNDLQDVNLHTPEEIPTTYEQFEGDPTVIRAHGGMNDPSYGWRRPVTWDRENNIARLGDHGAYHFDLFPPGEERNTNLYGWIAGTNPFDSESYFDTPEAPEHGLYFHSPIEGQEREKIRQALVPHEPLAQHDVTRQHSGWDSVVTGSVNPIQQLVQSNYDGFLSQDKVDQALRTSRRKFGDGGNEQDVTVSPAGYHAAVISSLGKINHFAPGLAINGEPYEQAMQNIPFASGAGEVHTIGHPHPVVAQAAGHIVSTGSPGAYTALQKAAPGTFIE